MLYDIVTVQPVLTVQRYILAGQAAPNEDSVSIAAVVRLHNCTACGLLTTLTHRFERLEQLLAGLTVLIPRIAQEQISAAPGDSPNAVEQPLDAAQASSRFGPRLTNPRVHDHHVAFHQAMV